MSEKEKQEQKKVIEELRIEASSLNEKLEDTHRVKVPSNEIPALLKNIHRDIWVVVTSNQLFIRRS